MATPIGRESVLGSVLGVMESGLAGRGGTLLLEGEGGTGKTTIFDWAAAQATERGAYVLRGPGYALAMDTPYAPFVAALRRTLRQDGADSLTRGLHALGLLFDGLQLHREDGLAFTRARLHDSLATLLGRLCLERPVVFIADDLHWYDQPSLEVLGLLEQDLSDLPMVVLTSIRLFESSERPDLRLLLRHVRRSSATTVVELTGLDRDALAQMLFVHLGSTAPSRLVDHVWHRSHGVPLVAQEVTNDLLRRGLLTRRGGYWDLAEGGELQVSERLVAVAEELIGDRIDRLDPSARQVLQVIALAGSPLDESHLGQVAGLSSDDLHQSIEHLVGLRLIVHGRDDEGRSTFVTYHPITGEAAVARLTIGERRRLHLRFLAALTDGTGASDDRLGSHLLGAGPLVQTGEHTHLLMNAARRALEQGAPAQATRLLLAARDATDVATDVATDGAHAMQISELLADAWERRDEGRLALDQLWRAQQGYQRLGDLAGESRVLSRLLDLNWHFPGGPGVDRRCDEVLALLEAEDRWDEVVELRTAQVQVYMRIERSAAMRDSLRAMKEAAHRCGSERGLVLADMLDFSAGLTAAMSVDTLRARTKGIREASRGHLDLESRCVLFDIDLALHRGDIEEIRAALASDRALSERAGRSPSWRCGLAEWEISMSHGEFDQIGDMELSAATTRPSRAAGFVGLTLVLTAMATGDLEAAEPLVERMLAQPSIQAGNDPLVAHLCDLAQFWGRVEPRSDVVERLSSGRGAPEFVAGLPWLGWVTRCLALARVEADQPGSGQTDTMIDAMINYGDRMAAWGWILRARRSPDPTQRCHMLLTAADGFEALHRPFEAARCVIEAAVSAPIEPDRLRAAGETINASGAPLLAQEAARVLAERGIAPRQTTTLNDPLGLTRREREVAEAVLGGLSNREVAARLYISVRTVTSHLDHIYTKLGISSRQQLAEAIGAAEDVASSSST